MPIVEFDVERKGLAEQFIQRLEDTAQQMLNDSLYAIASDISAEAPPHRIDNPKEGDVSLSESFYVIDAQEIERMTWEGYIASVVPEKARALEYGSGLHGPGRGRYPIYPRTARALSFEKEGRTLVLPMVMHPGVYAHHYIDIVLRRWRPLLAQRFGEAIQLAAVHHWATY